MFRFSFLGAACSVAVPFTLFAIASTANADPNLSDSTSLSAASALPEIVVSAQHLDEGRANIQTQTGASTYTFSSEAISALPSVSAMRFSSFRMSSK